ncbi:MAG: AraC family transcriptional regulator [Porphyromonadaceae bacterium]|nr:MAG: AraC family transcriptional regulator [Porphyromonadaceae bacterium]
MLEPVLYIGIAQSLFAGIIIATRRPQILADRYLAAWLFIIAIEMILAMVKLTWLEHLPYEIPFLVIPLVYGPLLFLYVRTLITEEPKWNWTDLAHFAPFILFLGLAFLFRSGPDETSSLPVWAHPGRFAKLIYELLVFASFTTYSIIVYVLLTRHRKAIREEFSFSSGKITLTWLLFVSITVYASYLLTFLSAGIQMLVIHLPFDPKIFSFTGLTLFSFAFSFYGHRQAQIFSSAGGPKNPMEEESVNSIKYAKSGLRGEDLRKLVHAMDDLMDRKKLFLNPELSLAEVSEELLIPKHHLTQAMNTELGKNFYAYINDLRVKKFIEMVVDPKYKDYTFLAIAFECGFNSKSTFNSVFKRITSFTPSEYLHSLGRPA